MLKSKNLIPKISAGILAFFMQADGVANISGFLYFDESLGHISGFAQIPRGGDYGTTSMLRPTFSELNINQDWMIDCGSGLTYADYFISASYHYLHPHGRDTLTEDLLTHAQFIPVGTQFYFENKYNWYTLSIGKDHCYQSWLISPFLQINWVKFHYHFDSDITGSSRSFSLVAANAGFKIQHEFNEKCHLDLATSASIPMSNLSIYTIELSLHYKIITDSFVTIIPRIAMGIFQLDNEDSQTVPNHFRYIAFPYGSIGFTVLFEA